MEKLTHKLQSAARALTALHEVLDFGQDTVRRDAAIQRFEFSVEAVWKTLKLYLQEHEGIATNSPKSVFREALTVGLINDDQTTAFLGMIDARNNTVHTYNEEMALAIAKEIPGYYNLMMNLITDLQHKRF